MSGAARSHAANERGSELADQGLDEEALDAYREAASLDPTNPSPWFNMALIHKSHRAWEDALQCGERAAELQPDDYPTWWNLGIAATALGRWPLARTAWRRCGIDVPDGDGPIDSLGLGPVPIRLDSPDAPEVVWAERLDPARGRLVNVPFPGSEHRWGDVVLHDGVPVGERVWHGQTVPVFDELERLEPSDVPTFEVHVTAPLPADSHALEELFFDSGSAAEDWTSNVRHLCDACSRASVPAQGEEGAWDPERHFGIAAHAHQARALLRRWADAGAGRSSGALGEPAL